MQHSESNVKNKHKNVLSLASDMQMVEIILRCEIFQQGDRYVEKTGH